MHHRPPQLTTGDGYYMKQQSIYCLAYASNSTDKLTCPSPPISQTPLPPPAGNYAPIKIPHPGADPCLVILINPQGCASRFSCPLEIGTGVRLEGLPSKLNLTARVVNCVSRGQYEKSWLLGLALTEPGNVWGIDAPPEDWGVPVSL